MQKQSQPKKFKVGALHFDSGKPRLELVPHYSAVSEALGMEYGAYKYDRDDWRLGMVYTKLLGSALRHLQKYNDVESYDIESGLNHIDHGKACLGILAWLIKTRPDLDDRHDGVRREPYSIEEIMQYRESVGLKTDERMRSFIERNVKQAEKDYQRWRTR